MLCTIVDGKGNPMKEGKPLNELSARLGEAIIGSVRRRRSYSSFLQITIHCICIELLRFLILPVLHQRFHN